MASASMTPRTSSSSVSSGNLGAACTSRLNPLLKWLPVTALATAWRDAAIHRPRPGSLRFTSGTTWPTGETTNRISSSTGRTTRVTAHIRCLADLLVGGPLSRSTGTVMASMRVTSSLRWLFFGGVNLLGGFGQIGLADPPGLDARLHDHGFGVLARYLAGIENARMFGRLTALLAFGPADEVVGGAACKIFHRLDVVLAELHQHFRGHAGYRLQRVVDAELLAPRFELGFLLLEMLPGAALQFVGRFIIKTLDAREFAHIDQRQLLDRGKTFRRQQLAYHLVDIERFHEDPRRVLEVGLAALGFLLFGEDVDIPAGELRGEPHILAASADRQ